MKSKCLPYVRSSPTSAFPHHCEALECKGTISAWKSRKTLHYEIVTARPKHVPQMPRQHVTCTCQGKMFPTCFPQRLRGSTWEMENPEHEDPVEKWTSKTTCLANVFPQSPCKSSCVRGDNLRTVQSNAHAKPVCSAHALLQVLAEALVCNETTLPRDPT